VATDRITLYSDPIADIDGDTLIAIRELDLTIGTSGEPSWEMLDNWLTEPIVGDVDMTIRLDASAAPVGYTARVWARYQDGSSPWTDWVDITASLSPALSAPPTSQTSYTYATGFQRIVKNITQPIVTFEIRAEILDAGSAVVASRVLPKQWYHADLA
jgi:hypothetical protein